MKASHAQASHDSLGDVAGERAKQYVDAGVDVYNAAMDKTRGIGKQVDGYVRTNPWLMVGAAAGVGLLVGLMLRRR